MRIIFHKYIMYAVALFLLIVCGKADQETKLKKHRNTIIDRRIPTAKMAHNMGK